MKTTIENKTNEAFIREWFWEHTYNDNDFNRKVYVINGKVFYADQKLTSEEKAYIKEQEHGEQLQYDVDHHKGNMNWW